MMDTVCLASHNKTIIQILAIRLTHSYFHFLLPKMALHFFQRFPFLFLVVAFLGKVSLALVPLGHQHRAFQLRQSPVSGSVVARVVSTSLFMQEGDESTGDVSQEQEDASVEETPEPVEDPEVVALKEEIASLESELKSKKSSLAYSLDQVEEYSKAGYARAVAEMENMRRVRSSMNSSNKSNAMAGVLRDFLPAYDTMNELKVKYANDEFGSKYSGLSIGPTFEKMGVKEFSVAGGGPVDLIRMKVVGSEYSEAAKDTVVAQVASGIELEGNVIRAAECITSLGSQDEANNASGNDETGVEESSGVE